MYRLQICPAFTRAFSILVISHISTANSSPPIRPSRSELRKLRSRLAVSSHSTVSPKACPLLSLTFLKSSISSRKKACCRFELSAEKIFLGLSNYGYDWPLPFVQGVTRAPSISNQRAIELAIEHDVAIQYDETAQAPFFHYTAVDGTVHEVWFEDARSLSARLALITEYGFQGAGIWNLMRPFSQLWSVISSLYNIVD